MIGNHAALRTGDYVVVAGLMLGLFASALDTMILSVALRTIADDLGGFTFQGWATSAYLIASTAVAPFYGRLADQFGSKRLYGLAIAVFILGSIGCSLATSMQELVAWRFVKGLGGGGLLALALTVLAEILPPRLRTRYSAWFGIVFTAASIVGPVVGGGLAEREILFGLAGWRWTFLINVPLGALSIWAITFAPRTAQSTDVCRQSIDWAGAILILLFVASLLLGLELMLRGPDLALAAASIVVSAAALVALLRREHKLGDRALIPMAPFRNRRFAALCGINAALGVALYAAASIIPLYLQVARDLSASQTGLLLVPQSISSTLSALCTDRAVAAREGRLKPLLVAALSALCVACLAWSFTGTETPPVYLVTIVTLFGAGMGAGLQLLLVGMQGSSPRSMIGMTNGLYSFGRQMGSAIGALMGPTILFVLARGKVCEILREAGGGTTTTSGRSLEETRPAPCGDLNSTAFMELWPEESAAQIRSAFASASTTALMITTLLFAAILLCALFLRASPIPPAPSENGP